MRRPRQEGGSPSVLREARERYIPNVIHQPKQTPITGRGHILMQYEPYMEKKKNFEFIHMGNMQFYHKDERMDINKEHYYPSFIALNVDELRDNRNTKKMLKNYRIFSEFKEEEDGGPGDDDFDKDSYGQEKSQDGLSKKSTQKIDKAEQLASN